MSPPRPHFLVLTFPLQGHIAPALRLARRLLAVAPDVLVTFSTTPRLPVATGHRGACLPGSAAAGYIKPPPAGLVPAANPRSIQPQPTQLVPRSPGPVQRQL